MNRTGALRVSLFAVAAAAAIIASVARAAAPAAPSAKELIKKIHVKNASLKSYSFVVRRSDVADKFVLKRNEEGLKAFKAILDKLSFLTRQSKDVSEGEKGYKQTVSTSLFIKPYTLQVTMDKSDYVPSFLQRSKVVYRPETNDSEVFLKDPFIGMLIRKDVENESSTILISNWTYELMELDCALANGGTAKVTGRENVDGKPAHVLEVAVKKGKIPWAVGCGGKQPDVPKKAYTQLNRELGMMQDRIKEHADEPARIKLWIDADSMLIVRKEVTFGKTVAIKFTVSDIKLNNVKPEDMEAVKKK